jgi:tetratricopeptide (TPR) repeat protein
MVIHYLKNYQDAIKCSEKALELDPNYIRALVNKVFTLIKLNEEDQALRVLRKALKLNEEETLDWIERVKNILGS